MAKLIKRFIEDNVLVAAKKRIHHLFDTFDKVVVCFSGGKDSLVVLHLVHEVSEERGEGKVNVMFWDEELIPNSVIDFVDSYRTQPWVNMKWLCVPLKSTKYILGRTFDYTQWDPNRPHVREMPDWGIRQPEDIPGILDQYSLNEFGCRLFEAKGRTVFLNGMRAAESLTRQRASLAKLHDSYIHDSGIFATSKPIYDWQENDVFRYFFDRAIRYCTIYDHQIMAGAGLRVATPLHAEAAKRIGRLREIDPDFYNRVLRVFPEMAIQDRYYNDLDFDGLRKQYGQSLEGVKSYIIEKYGAEDGQLDLALSRLESIRRSSGHYPPEYVLGYFVGGAIKRMLAPKYLHTNSR